ncbi:MAG: hypothetical protein JNL38_11365 [Myxococcales bacterium]|jgi:cytochrome c553|nr:hypothetical protein [Myxococcales bacterium]
MGRYLLIAALSAAALIACSDGATSGQLGQGGNYPGGGDNEPAPPGTKDNNPRQTNDAPAPIPQSGPGSKDSQARQYFIDNVYASLNGTCGGCHSSGAAGAPKFMSTDASATYQLFDQRGYIVATNSILVTHKHTGAGTEPTADQMSKMQTWLQKEGLERVGQKAPEDILGKIGKCINPADWKAAEAAVRNIATVQRQGENGNQCHSCNVPAGQAACASCHAGGDYGMVAGLQNQTYTTDLVRTRPFINKFFGMNGTDVIPSDAVKSKGVATQTGAPYSHPKYTISPQAEQAIQTMVTNTVAAYKAGTCAP